jgi:tRNA-dihydrouridine synthase
MASAMLQSWHAEIADALSIPVFGSGDCVEPVHVVDRLATGVDGVLVGRGVLRNPWILAQAQDLVAGRPPRSVALEDRGRFLLEYIDLLGRERVRESEGFRHSAPGHSDLGRRSHDRWVINKIRALGTYFTKGHDTGSHARVAINGARSIGDLHGIIQNFFLLPTTAPAAAFSIPRQD